MDLRRRSQAHQDAGTASEANAISTPSDPPASTPTAIPYATSATTISSPTTSLRRTLLASASMSLPVEILACGSDATIERNEPSALQLEHSPGGVEHAGVVRSDA
ncbi:hypothetical protein [Desertimonas flava]|uniref:hypothetical protein n=1 Tax=Desertimonas flava TaxID=2064846 RepID=UPI0013C50DFD|nr:hypothetical protein [Desertimonas flava]